MSDRPNRAAQAKSKAATSDVYPIRVACDFRTPKPKLTVNPKIATPRRNQRLKFICDDAELVIIAQYHSLGSKESDHSPFQNNILALQVPMNSPKTHHVTVKDDDAQPVPGTNHRAKHVGYKYTIVAISPKGQVAVKDPTIIIK